MKKLLIALFAAAAFTVSAQTARSGSWAIEFPKDGKAVNVTQTFTPFFKIENEERVIDMRLNERDMNNAKHWLSVDVVFTTNAPKSASAQWKRWLDDVVVDIYVFIPSANDRGTPIWTVLNGKQTLASLQADDSRHFVRMMIPPEVIYRHFAFDGTTGDLQKDYSKITSELKKLAPDLPVMAVITCNGRSVSGYQACGKEVFNRLEKAQGSSNQAKLFYTYLKTENGSSPTVASTAKLFKYIYDNRFNAQTYRLLENALLPVSKTPFAWVLFDRFEAVKDKENSGK